MSKEIVSSRGRLFDVGDSSLDKQDGDEFVEPLSMDKNCPVSRVVTSTSARVAGQRGLSKPPSLDKCCPSSFCQIVQGGHVLWLCKRGLMCQMREVFVFDDYDLFLTVGECIEDKRYILSFVADVCSASAVLLHSVTCGLGTYQRHEAQVSGAASWCKKLGHHFSSRQLPKSLCPL